MFTIPTRPLPTSWLIICFALFPRGRLVARSSKVANNRHDEVRCHPSIHPPIRHCTSSRPSHELSAPARTIAINGISDSTILSLFIHTNASSAVLVSLFPSSSFFFFSFSFPSSLPPPIPCRSPSPRLIAVNSPHAYGVLARCESEQASPNAYHRYSGRR